MIMNYKKKLRISVIITLLIIIIVSSATYAVYKWQSTVGLNVSISVSDSVIITFNGGTDITGRLIPVSSPEQGIVKKISIKSNFPNSDTFSIYLKTGTLPGGLMDSSFKWRLTDCDLSTSCTSTINRTGNFTTASMNGFIDQVSGDMVLLENHAIPYIQVLDLYLYLWIDGNVDNNANMESKSIDFDLYAKGTSAGSFVEASAS